MQDSIVIVGAGLSGLHAASLLAEKGVPCRVLEARDRIGGRVLTEEIPDKPDIGKFDLGPTWFWPQHEPVITNLVEKFGLKTIVQHTEGAVLIEQSKNGPIQQGVLPEGAIEKSVRLAGGMQALVDTMAAGLPTETIELNTRVTAIKKNEEGNVTLDVLANGKESKIYAGVVILALPPRVTAQHIAFSPPLGDELSSTLMAKPTWMGEQAKAVAIYDRPFWRENGLSGQAMSWGGGPLQEIHDASPDTGYGALFGFFGIPPEKRRQVGEENVRKHVTSQLKRLFGQDAEEPIAFLYKDWSRDPGTTVHMDTERLSAFPDYGQPTPSNEWKNKIVFAGTETSRSHGGHLEGALRSAELAVSEVLESGTTS